MSSSIVLYQQVKLKKKGRVQIAWIPVEYAKKGKVLKIKDQDIWEDGWHVAWVFREITKTQEEALIDKEQYKHQREMSDV